MFHNLEDAPGPINFPPALFSDFMNYLSDEGFKSLTFGAAVEIIRSGHQFPDRSFVVTFDDGFRSVYDIALPVLAELDLCATVFLTTGSQEANSRETRIPPVEGQEMLSWKEVDELVANEFEIAAHTMNHPDLARLENQEIHEECSRSREIIEQRTGREVSCFAYPFGSFNRRVKDIVAEIFRGACSVKLSLASQQSDPYAVERVDAFYLRNRSLFRIIPSPMFAGYLGALRLPRSIRGTLKGSG